jgi:hypothetical protein
MFVTKPTEKVDSMMTTNYLKTGVESAPETSCISNTGLSQTHDNVQCRTSIILETPYCIYIAKYESTVKLFTV